jgi:ferredoxin
MSVRVSVDDRRCELVGYCSRIAPDVFDTTSGDTARILKESVDDPDLAAAVFEAEAICPTAAIAAVEES